MTSTVHVASSNEFRTLLSSHNVVVTDFYADWCGPCKAIAPVFEQLSTKFSKPKATAFAKVDVDKHQQISQQYGVSAMPTFIIFKGGRAVNTIRGADPRALTAAVEAAVKTSAPASFNSKGHTLGGPSTKPATSLNRPVTASIQPLIQAIIAFFGLYFVSLFSLDPYAAAENSQFNIHRVPPPPQPTTSAGTSSGVKKQTAPSERKVGTISGLTGES